MTHTWIDAYMFTDSVHFMYGQHSQCLQQEQNTQKQSTNVMYKHSSCVDFNCLCFREVQDCSYTPMKMDKLSTNKINLYMY